MKSISSNQHCCSEGSIGSANPPAPSAPSAVEVAVEDSLNLDPDEEAAAAEAAAAEAAAAEAAAAFCSLGSLKELANQLLRGGVAVTPRLFHRSMTEFFTTYQVGRQEDVGELLTLLLDHMIATCSEPAALQGLVKGVAYPLHNPHKCRTRHLT